MYKSNNTFEFPCNNWIFSWNLIINDDSYRYIISSAMNASLFALKSNKIDRLMNPDTQTVNEHFDGIYENVLLILDMFSLCFANFHMFFWWFAFKSAENGFWKPLAKWTNRKIILHIWKILENAFGFLGESYYSAK